MGPQYLNFSMTPDHGRQKDNLFILNKRKRGNLFLHITKLLLPYPLKKKKKAHS